MDVYRAGEKHRVETGFPSVPLPEAPRYCEHTVPSGPKTTTEVRTVARHSPQVTDDSDALPPGEARLVIHDECLTITIEGNEDEVRRRYLRELASITGTSVAESEAAVEEYELPAIEDLAQHDAAAFDDPDDGDESDE